MTLNKKILQNYKNKLNKIRFLAWVCPSVQRHLFHRSSNDWKLVIYHSISGMCSWRFSMLKLLLFHMRRRWWLLSLLSILLRIHTKLLDVPCIYGRYNLQCGFDLNTMWCT